MRLIFALVLGLVATVTPAVAQDREFIGAGRLFNNDVFGDGYDRWRTGSYVYSNLRARGPYTGGESFGDLLEYRLRTEIVAPERGTTAPGDRPYAGMLSLGVHTHFNAAGTQMSLGGDIVAVGPSTRMSQFQEYYHDTFSLPDPPHVDQQLADAIWFNANVSASKQFQVNDTLSVRPFVQAQAGVEDLMRAGADVWVGAIGQQDLKLRDVVTGQLYRGSQSGDQGMAYVFGIDVAAVSDSRLLPADQGYIVSPTRTRARAGVHWQLGQVTSLFGGATYLSEEFTGQRSGQVVGSLKLNFNF